MKTSDFFVIFEAVSRMKSRISEDIRIIYAVSVMYHSIGTNNYGMNKATPCYLLLLFVRHVEKKKVKRNFEENKSENGKKTDIRKGKIGKRGEWSYN